MCSLVMGYEKSSDASSVADVEGPAVLVVLRGVLESKSNEDASGWLSGTRPSLSHGC